MDCKFYIGQQVVAIRNHSQGYFKKGQIFEVLDIMKGCCHYAIRINDEYLEENYIAECAACKSQMFRKGYIFYTQDSFAPVQEISDFTFEDAIALVTKKTEVQELIEACREGYYFTN